MKNVLPISLSFGIGGNATSLLGPGWSHEEEGAIWAIGAESHLTMPRPDNPATMKLVMNLRPYVNPPTVLRQRMTVRVNGVDIANFEVTEPSNLECRIPVSVATKSDRLHIVFRHPDSVKPSGLANTSDDRPLSFAFTECQLSELEELPPLDSDYFIPPDELLFDGTTNAAGFKLVGEGFTRVNLIARGGLQPTWRVLDLGSGNGQKARVLAYYLSAQGSYEGLDIVASGIEWCQNRYAALPNFRFQVADVFSSHYNPQGRFQDTNFRLPFTDGEFDMVFLSSVFTHMMPAGVAHYISEISRVLKVGGRCVSTFFLLNSDTVSRIESGASSLKFLHQFELCRVIDPQNPSQAVAIEESWLREKFAQAGLRVVEATYGFWCGGKDLLGAYQDVLISFKEPGRVR